MRKSRSWFLFFIGALLILTIPAQAQDLSDIVDMQVDPGFGSYFRESHWFPLRISVNNQGDDITGKLVVRPETSGRVVSNTYSTPIDLPAGSEKSTFLYIQARSFPRLIRVELLDDDGFIIQTHETTINNLGGRDQLFAVVTGPTGDSIPLGNVHVGGYQSQQANWQADNIPNRAVGLMPLDMMLVSNLDSTSLTSPQITAITQWVTAGGHLIVTGGPNWQGTADALVDLLPMTPEGSQSIDDLSGLAIFSGDDTALTERTVIATGNIKDDARVLVESDGIPLLVRHSYGAGTVDYLVADPTLEPLRSWGKISELWLTLVSTVQPEPGWTLSSLNAKTANISLAVLPGVDLLPQVTALCIFLLAYVFLIGPVNYLILSRINRREWAWFTIPLLIIIFTVFAWTRGFSLRGEEALISRLSVVESWTGTEDARVRQLIGLLSPRRLTYSMHMQEDRFLGVLAESSQSGLFGTTSVQTSTEIIQRDTFSAESFSIDGGIFANFSTVGMMPAPDISGSLALTYDEQEGENNIPFQSLQGVVRNDSDITLHDPLILANNIVYRLDGALEPGDVVPLGANDLVIFHSGIKPNPSPLEHAYLIPSALETSFHSPTSNAWDSVGDVMGESFATGRNFRTRGFALQDQINHRRQVFLGSFMKDSYASTSRGHRAYLMGWSDDWENDIEIIGAGGRFTDTTLYIVELDVTVETPPASQQVQLTRDQFVWITRDSEGIPEVDPNQLLLVSGASVEFRFMPLAGAILSEVTEVSIGIDRVTGYARTIPVEIWDWQLNQWESLEFRTGEVLTFEDTDRYLGPNNVVDLRASFEFEGGSIQVRGLYVEQAGHF